ncbi:type II toxin-antitoxin system VapC family toxin [Microbacterium pseudoresistens]|uniref:Ribonuclease VapC n=1 Tax=Microbacterium pseudoresistens TaxID=640634 RepID=A0A7Y9ETT3_9MICO|nr:type II toxin-antitoxin system VapC family toxin [Microbacterium pseudoresistens]NYD53818.1 ribonuclease VapC [Microbacterium pseudoresistens]
MIVDTSALIAIAKHEPEAPRFQLLLKQHEVAMSAATLVEAEVVARMQLRQGGLAAVRGLIRAADTRIVPVDEVQASIGSDAYEKYGRGSGSPARLNYGDCFSYALAIAHDEPLLCKGADFIHTDVRIAE